MVEVTIVRARFHLSGNRSKTGTVPNRPRLRTGSMPMASASEASPYHNPQHPHPAFESLPVRSFRRAQKHRRGGGARSVCDARVGRTASSRHTAPWRCRTP